MLLAIDTGGTKTLIARFTDDGVIDKEFRFPTPSEPEAYLDLLVTTLREEFIQPEPPESLVIATPGLHSEGMVTWAGNRLQWSNVPVIETLRPLFPHTSMYLENDANLGGLGEVRRLEAIPELALYVTISTDIGTGVITRGTINSALRHSEGGHAMIEYGGHLVRWGDIASGRAIYETFGQYAKDITDPATWNDIATRISRGFLAQLPLLLPEVVVIGGSMGTYFSMYEAPLLKILSDELPGHLTLPRFVEAKDAERAVIYGCYYHALDQRAHH